jgi:hypothetical protein
MTIGETPVAGSQPEGVARIVVAVEESLGGGLADVAAGFSRLKPAATGFATVSTDRTPKS